MSKNNNNNKSDDKTPSLFSLLRFQVFCHKQKRKLLQFLSPLSCRSFWIKSWWWLLIASIYLRIWRCALIQYVSTSTCLFVRVWIYVCISGLLKCHNKIVDDGDALTLCVLVLTPAFYFRFRWNGNLNCSVAREAVGKRERNELLQGYLLRRGQPEGNGETWSLHLQNENLLISPIQFSIFVSL